MKDFANRNNKRNTNVKNKRVFRSKKPNAQTISNNTIIFLLIISFGLGSASFLYFKTDVVSIKPEDSINSVIIDFPTSLIEDSILIESLINDGIQVPEKYLSLLELYTANIPTDIQVMINDNESGVILLRLVEIIGEDLSLIHI